MQAHLPTAEKILQVSRAFTHQKIPFAFGGAIARNYYAEPRLTLDLDLSVFVAPEANARVLDALAPLFAIPNRQEVTRIIRRDAQVRLDWDFTPLDLFFSYDPFHSATEARVRQVPFADATIPILSVEDVLLHKLLFNRAKDWRDMADILYSQQGAIDFPYIRYWLNYFFPAVEPQQEQTETERDLRFRRFDSLVEAIQRSRT